MRTNKTKNNISVIGQWRKTILYGGLLLATALTAVLFVRNRYTIGTFLVNPYERQLFFENLASRLQDFLTLTLGIIVEALPFVVIGVAFSVLVQLVLPIDKIISRLPRNRYARRAIISLLGVMMPVCECGNLPVARSMMIKGFSVQEAVVFLLSAPSVNIITFIVTLEAFNFEKSLAFWRVIITLIIANVTAVILTDTLRKKDVMTKQFMAACSVNSHDTHKIRAISQLFSNEMWNIGRLLVIGAMIAAATQTIVPRELITSIGSNIYLSTLAMLVLAFVVSLCSSVDAFFALAYVNVFSLGSILAFLVAGPMVDIKMITMMKTTFTFRALAIICASVLTLSFITGVLFSYVW